MHVFKTKPLHRLEYIPPHPNFNGSFFILHILPEDRKPMAFSILLIVIAHFSYTEICHLGKHKIMRNGPFLIHYKSDQQTHTRSNSYVL